MLKQVRVVVLGMLMLVGVGAKADTIGLQLLLDGSGSLTQAGWDEQVTAYKNIFGSTTFYNDFVTSGDTLQVQMWQFATGVQQLTGVYTITSDPTTSVAFANAIPTNTYNGGYTNTPSGIHLATLSLLNQSGLDRMVIDVSTDGRPNVQGYPSWESFQMTLTQLQVAVNNGITTNFIGVGPNISTSDLSQLAAAGNGFYTTAPDLAGFQVALEDKLYHEINNVPVPAPASIGLLLAGLLGLAGMRRRKA